MNECIRQIEAYAQEIMCQCEIAHDYKHVDRVRRWALRIAEAEGYQHLDQVQAAALLHDIGLLHGRAGHGPRGAEMAAQFLRENALFSAPEIVEITGAIRNHTSLDGDGTLALILRDADILDLLGPVGIMRAFTSKAAQPEYLPDNVKGDTWGITAVAVTERFTAGQGIGPTIVDHLNFQISCYENLRTPSAREWARPLQAYMQSFLCELENQILRMSFRTESAK
ncbi:MAG TPA: HD domain-containing protein [Chloroflexota bacterium]|nr:HD domain-containing protein [Chloroflexota bacterium]HUM69254.1 HD domain-containing protein [Chloroflexota bacterium]